MERLLRERQKMKYHVFLFFVLLVSINFILEYPLSYMASLNSSITPNYTEILEEISANSDDIQNENGANIAKQVEVYLGFNKIMRMFPRSTVSKYRDLMASSLIHSIMLESGGLALHEMRVNGLEGSEEYELIKDILIKEVGTADKFLNLQKSSAFGTSLNNELVDSVTSTVQYYKGLAETVLDGGSITLEDTKLDLSKFDSSIEKIRRLDQLNDIKVIILAVLLLMAYLWLYGTPSQRKEAVEETRRAFDEVHREQLGLDELEEKLLKLYKEENKSNTATDKTEEV